MKVTHTWLREFIDIDWAPEEIAEKLTLSGSEVESVGPVPSLFEHIVVGKIENIEQVPGSDHLTLCTVNLGKRAEKII